MLITASEIFQRPYLGPPGMRPEHVKILREAFQKTLNDPAFLEEVKSKKLDAEYTSGEETEALAKEIMSQRPEIIERLKKVLGDQRVRIAQSAGQSSAAQGKFAGILYGKRVDSEG